MARLLLFKRQGEHRLPTGKDWQLGQECRRSYKALVVGKRGTSRIKGLVLGSIAAKLLQRASFVPLFLVGRDPRPGKFLIAFDGSEDSMRAVDCVGSMLGGTDCEINLTNVIRNGEDEKSYIAPMEDMIAEAFDEAIGRLTDAGVPLKSYKHPGYYRPEPLWMRPDRVAMGPLSSEEGDYRKSGISLLAESVTK